MYDVLTSSASNGFDAPAASGMLTGGRTAAGAAVLTRMLDVVDYGVMLILDDGHIVFANKVARGELDDCHPLQAVGDHLLARSAKDVAALRAAVHDAAHKGLQRLLSLTDPKGEAVTVAIIPIAERSADTTGSVMLVFGKRNVCDDLSADAFARQHKLTATEARVLKLLCTGRRPTEIALAQGVALSTVRTQIGSVRDKTGTRSIGALVREVGRLPPLVRLLRPA